MKIKNLLSLSIVFMLAISLTGCFNLKNDTAIPEETVSSLEDNDMPKETVKEEPTEEEADNSLSSKSDMVEIKDEIINSNITDRILQVGNQVINLDDGITYGQFIDIATKELDGELEFFGQFYTIKPNELMDEDIYFERNGEKCLYFQLRNTSDTEQDAKDCKVFFVTGDDCVEGIAVSYWDDIIFAGNFCEAREDCKHIEEKITFDSKEETVKYYFNSEDCGFGEDARAGSIKFVQIDQKLFVYHIWNIIDRDTNDGTYSCCDDESGGWRLNISPYKEDSYEWAYDEHVGQEYRIAALEKAKQEHPEYFTK